jgi:hypothetical protein
MDHLQEQGYEPQDATDSGDWYDLIVSGIGTVRVCVYPDDGYRVDIHTFDAYMICEWSATLSLGTPDAAVIAVIGAAESQLADRRGGPVTPAQAGTA